MRPTIVLLLVSALALSTAVGCSQVSGDAVTADDDLTGQDRAAIMDALRVSVKPELANQDIVFNVQGQGGVLRVEGNWAWLQGQIQLRSGGEPTTRGTLYEQDAKLGIFDGFRIEALLQKDASGWTMVEKGIGSTDVWWWEIEGRYAAAPRAIFPWLDTLQNGNEIVASERMAVMNALRKEVKREIPNQEIVFNVRGEGGVFRIKGDYAWLQGNIELRTGGAPSTAGTAYEAAAKEGLFDGFRIEALLKKDTNGNWTVANHGVGSTDVWWWGIWESHPDADRALWGDHATK